MVPSTSTTPPPSMLIPLLSPLALSDRLITLAKQADGAGYAVTAGLLVQLAMTVFDEVPRPRMLTDE
jgi:hypothetical protein